MELFESNFKKFINMAKVMKLVEEDDEFDTSGAVTFKQAKKMRLLPIDGPNSDERLREKNLNYFTITKPNKDGFSKVIYWIEKEDADKAGDDFRLDKKVNPSLYS